MSRYGHKDVEISLKLQIKTNSTSWMSLIYYVANVSRQGKYIFKLFVCFHVYDIHANIMCLCSTNRTGRDGVVKILDTKDHTVMKTIPVFEVNSGNKVLKKISKSVNVNIKYVFCIKWNKWINIGYNSIVHPWTLSIKSYPFMIN